MAEETVQIHVFSRDFDEFFVRFAEQIGKGEVFVQAEELLEVGTPVTLVFSIVYEDLVFFSAAGAISHVEKSKQTDSGNEVPGGMLIKLDEIDDRIRTFIIELVKRQLRSELSRMFTT